MGHCAFAGWDAGGGFAQRNYGSCLPTSHHRQPKRLFHTRGEECELPAVVLCVIAVAEFKLTAVEVCWVGSRGRTLHIAHLPDAHIFSPGLSLSLSLRHYLSGISAATLARRR